MSKLICGLLLAFCFNRPTPPIPDSKLAKNVRVKVWPRLQTELNDKGLKPGSALYIRIFKEEDNLKIWVKTGQHYQFFKSYNICFFSGGLGPKLRKGDMKSPEGFYTVRPGQLNPFSSYYLAINIGYSNKVEQAKGCTGDAIMIHGICASDGCYAMTNDGIEDIYTLVYEAFAGGQKTMHLDIFPFRMDDAHMKKYAGSSVIGFWRNLKPGYELFEKNHIPANAEPFGREYKFRN
ncbi:MAG TPA: murein L,D-transpeptidase family protein [Mucilaginibacter sp.]|jgi:murein L,D-transpeptidase YafK|nr:murein L,D-transpeptidase family protein [Mucilaginibacter sp.]